MEMPIVRKGIKKRAPRCFLAPFVWLVVVLWLIERFLWRVLTGLGQLLGRLPILRQIEEFAATLPPWGAALLMALPLLLAEPLKIEAIHLFYRHHWMLGSTLLICTKIGGTAFIARLYTVCRPALMQLRWFAWGHEKFFAAKGWVESTRTAQKILARIRVARAVCKGRAAAWGRRVSLMLRAAKSRRAGMAGSLMIGVARMWSAWRRLGRQKARRWRQARVV